MAKVKSLGKVVDEAATLLQRLVRMKAADDNGYCQCVTCGKVDHWKSMDGGHYISRTYTQHKLLEENVHPQCKGCNRFGHRCHDDYSLYMTEMYGAEFVKELTETKRTTKKYSRPELEVMIQDLKAQIKEQESRIS